jgi:hypothetical protein
MSGHPDPALALSANDIRALEDRRIQLQSELSRVTASQTLADALVLFDDTVAFAASFLRDAAAQAATVSRMSVASRRLQQGRALDDAAREIKRMANMLSASNPRIRTTYLLWAVTGILGFTASDEVTSIIREAQRSHPYTTPPSGAVGRPPLPYPPPQVLQFSPVAPPPPPPAFHAPPPPPPVPPPPPPPQGQIPLLPARNRGIGKVVPACAEVIGANVPNAIDSSTKVCYLCGRTGHLAFSCFLSAPVRLGEPLPGWTTQGTKVQELWSSPTDITPACAKLWIDFLNRRQISGNPDASGRFPLPDFHAVASRG